ncbi:hypothetical protein JYU14_00250 [Simkania negevensis]|uniref:Ppx/GppA phosphatase N-terminal domain-containing protein n=1 Tax=Simkania negevensis TaxID=83561 RepID=A0ABS3AU26_9BACT|nr:hypothetical protein [Simkania negevensis]
MVSCLIILLVGMGFVPTGGFSAEKALPTHRQGIVHAAIDFGSGAVKIQAAFVEGGRVIGRPLLAKYVSLSLTEDVAAHGGRISEEMQRRAVEILQGFKDEAKEAAGAHEVQFSGIATAVFRKAENGGAALDNFERLLGIRFQTLTQEEEGKVGFLTAQTLYPEVVEGRILAWDSGNGSFQMTAKDGSSYQVFQGPLGHGNVRVMLSRDIRGGEVLRSGESGNPVSVDERRELAERLVQSLPPLPVWLQDKIASKETMIVTFGDGESIFALVAKAAALLAESDESVAQSMLITQEDVQRVIDLYIGRNDDLFDSEGVHRKTLLSAVHLMTLMKHCKISVIHYSQSIGSTLGMLRAPSLWN